ncbi:MAG TPA: ABC transporter permease subunit, partial [Bacteroidota bacterium]|nr:ABC transporter permease subunit [Bacteroidota bacterium]
SFTGLVVASVIYSLPFMVNPLVAGLEALPPSIREASLTLGRSEMATLFRVMLPAAKPSVITALVLTFAHTVGEFGVVLMIGGNIPGRTRVASIAIYNEVERLDYAGAHAYSLILLSFAFIVLLAVSILNRRTIKTF